MDSDLTGKKLGPFLVEDLLGKGAMGAVYRATHRKTGKQVAIKVISNENNKDDTFHARFEREIKLLSQFRHPNIVRIHGDSDQDGIRYYAMEMVDGRPLSDIIEEKGKLSIRRTIAYGVQICEALQEIHRVGVIHRDLKPANLMVTRDHQIKLMDFGIAKDVSSSFTKEITQADRTVGTVSYMSPEQLAGQELTRKSDLYALGILLYRMLTGRLPFTGETMFEYMNQRMQGAYALPSIVDDEIPREFDELLQMMLAQHPEDRPRDTYVVMQKLMDIAKKAKEGTLSRTNADTNAALVETVEIPKSNSLGTFLRSVTDIVSTGSQGKKKKRRSKGKDPFYESPLFLGACLLVILCVVAVAFWPAGPSSMLKDAQALLSKETPYDWQQAIDGYLTPLIENYPDSEEAVIAKQLREEYSDKAKLTMAKGEHRRDRITSGPPADAANARKFFWDAFRLKEQARFQEARVRFSEIAQRFGDDEDQRGWALLAQLELRTEIRGQVYHDLEGDGEKQPTDPGLPRWLIYHDSNRNEQLDDGERSTETDGDGFYVFEDLPRGVYNLRLEMQPEWKLSTPPEPLIEVSVSDSELRTDVDFGLVPVDEAGGEEATP